MLITKPAYFDAFRCIASNCPDSCCKEWDVQVDPHSAACYRALPGSLGDRLREVLYEEDGETYMAIVDDRCPMWRDDGLCRIQAELGETSLCKTCQEFPRLTHDYGSFVELGLELSCPEAARIILTTQESPRVSDTVPGGEAPEYDEDAMAVLKSTREVMLTVLQNRDYSPNEVLILALDYAAQAQAELDGAEPFPYDPAQALEALRPLAATGDIQKIAEFFSGLEILTPQWRQMLLHPKMPKFPEAVRLLARYFVERYWLQAVSDYALTHRAKFIVISCILICSLDGDFIRNAQLFSKEIENNYNNVEAILDAVYSHPAFTDFSLLGLLWGFGKS